MIQISGNHIFVINNIVNRMMGLILHQKVKKLLQLFKRIIVEKDINRKNRKL
jgi:hypothetical protein